MLLVEYGFDNPLTSCAQVRSPLDDVNSVTSGETATSDSGRGGSEDDGGLPPIAEVPPECGSKSLCLCVCLFVCLSIYLSVCLHV